MNKLAVILPYNQDYIDNFTEHFGAVVEQKDFYYKLVFIKQRTSGRPINKGKLFNIGYSLMKDKFDYFCFHDIDFIPLSNFDYTPNDYPISLYNGLHPIEFGEHEGIEDFNDFDLVNDTHFGGALIFDKRHFEMINGYSNDYWGLGFEDRDLLLRMVTKGVRLKSIIEKPLRKSFASYNGRMSYSYITPHNNMLRKTTMDSFTMSIWFRINDYPEHGADVDNNRCEYFLFGRPGYHTGLSITHEGRLKGVVWNKSDRPSLVFSKPVRRNEWNHASMVVELESLSLHLYLNGELSQTTSVSAELKDYLGKNFFIGVGNPDSNSWRNFFKGDIAELGLWDTSLTDTEISKIYNDGITSRLGKYTTSHIPVLHHNFDCGYDDIVFDMSGNGNHLFNKNVELGKKWTKTSEERYLPYRREGYYGYIGNVEELTELRNPTDSTHPAITHNRNIFNKKISNFENGIKKDGLNNTKFRIVNRENYKDKHEIIEVVI